MPLKKEEKIVLTDQEKGAIEAQRVELAKLEKFRTEYQKLVEETGYGWLIDTNSPLNNLQLGIGKLK